MLSVCACAVAQLNVAGCVMLERDNVDMEKLKLTTNLLLLVIKSHQHLEFEPDCFYLVS